MHRFRDPLTQRIVEFLTRIGIIVDRRELTDETFLRGVDVDAGTLLVDEERLAHPGDLLHEAGHIAVVPANERSSLSGNLGDDGVEMAAIAWSYAACVFLGLPADVVFHAKGYRGESSWLLEHFRTEATVGVPILEWRGMTLARDRVSTGPVYPHMTKWLSD